MAFVGTPTIKKLGEHIYRITDVSLTAWSNEDPTTNGTIGIGPGDTEVDIELPDLPPHSEPMSLEELADIVEVRVNVVLPVNGGDIRVRKTTFGGRLVISLAYAAPDVDAPPATSGGLEIYVQFWHSAVR